MRALSGVLVALFCCFPLPGSAQQSTPKPAERPVEAPRSAAGSPDRRIAVDVVVTDKKGNPVPGLQQQDFTVLDDKQPQKILSFHATEESSKAAAPPVQAILLLDTVNASYISVGYERL